MIKIKSNVVKRKRGVSTSWAHISPALILTLAIIISIQCQLYIHVVVAQLVQQQQPIVAPVAPLAGPLPVPDSAAAAAAAAVGPGPAAGLVAPISPAPIPIPVPAPIPVPVPIAAVPLTSGNVIATEPLLNSVQPKSVTDLVWQRFLLYKQSPLYVPPYDPNVLALPDLQLDFVRKISASDLALFREILYEAIESRRKFAPSMKLIFKYAGKLLATLIRNRREELLLPERIEPSPEFFTMLANIAETTLDRSALVKVERGYTKDNINIESFRSRVEGLFDYLQRIVDVSPLGGYLRWDTLRLYTDQPQNPLYNVGLIDETSDLVAQFRAMGYENSIFVARRIVNLLRLFARGVTPASDKEV